MRPNVNFHQAMKAISPNVPWVHHGRDSDGGLDCIGLVLELYRRAGLSIDNLDIAYGYRDADRAHRNPLIVGQLLKKFDPIAVQTPRETREGDVILIGSVHQNHIAVIIGSCAVEVSKKGLVVTGLSRMWGHVTAIYRHKELL